MSELIKNLKVPVSQFRSVYKDHAGKMLEKKGKLASHDEKISVELFLMRSSLQCLTQAFRFSKQQKLNQRVILSIVMMSKPVVKNIAFN